MHWDDDGGWGHMSDGGAGWGWLLAALLLVVLIAAVVALIVVLTRPGPLPPPPPASAPPTPLDAYGTDPVALRILQRRFTSGEIDEAEYRACIEALRAHGD